MASVPEGAALAYSIERGNGAGLFAIDAAGALFSTGAGEACESGVTSHALTARATGACTRTSRCAFTSRTRNLTLTPFRRLPLQTEVRVQTGRRYPPDIGARPEGFMGCVDDDHFGKRELAVAAVDGLQGCVHREHPEME